MDGVRQMSIVKDRDARVKSRHRKRKSRPLVDHKKSALIKRTIDIMDHQVLCGLDTVIISLRIGSWKQLTWPNRFLEPFPTAGGLRVSYAHAHLRVEFEAGKYVTAGEEELLPLVDWPNVYRQMIDEVELELKCDGIWNKYPAIVSRLDIAFDIYYNDTAALVYSLQELPVRAWDRKHSCVKSAYLKSISSSHRRERTIYDRSDLTGGIHVVRFESRYQRPDAVNRALKLPKGQKTRPLYLADADLMGAFVERLFHHNGIYPNVTIVSFDQAVREAIHGRTKESLLNYKIKRSRNQDYMQPEYYREKYGIMIGNSKSKSSAVVKYYEGLKRAFMKSIEKG